MTRTVKGHKAPGAEYWGRRPGGRNPGPATKRNTHKAERQQGRALSRTAMVQADQNAP